MRKFSFFKTYKNAILVGIGIGVVLAALILVFGQSVLDAFYKTPTGRMMAMSELVELIQEEHIYAEDSSQPLQIAYKAYFETDVIPDEREIKTTLKAEIKADDENYYTIVNLMLSHYDKYSNCYAPEINAQMYPDDENYKGLGVEISSYGPFIRIGSIFEGSVAERVGLQTGDWICSIGGIDIRTCAYADAQALLAEEMIDGTTIGVLRAGEQEILFFDVTAEEVVIPNVSWEIDGQTAILDVTLFRGDTFKDDVTQAFEEFHEADVNYLIVDLRDNRGGYISYLEHLLNQFFTEEGELLFTEHFRNEDDEFTATGIGMEFDAIYVLINEDTASSAEVLAGRLKDMGCTLIGETTYGKAVGLTNYNFYGDKLVLATMTLELPITGDYNDVGITPTVELAQAFVKEELEPCTPIDEFVDLDAYSAKEHILALEERLVLLGYQFAEADNVWDADTDAALHAVYMARDTEYSGICEAEVLEALDMLCRALYDAVYLDDTQLSYAYACIDSFAQSTP